MAVQSYCADNDHNLIGVQVVSDSIKSCCSVVIEKKSNAHAPQRKWVGLDSTAGGLKSGLKLW